MGSNPIGSTKLRMRKALLFAAGVTTIWLFVCAAPAVAVCTQPHPRVCTQFFHSDAVFAGKVISIRNWPPEEKNPGGWFYRLRVTKTYRGPARDIIEVFTENASARFPLELGQTYLLFASKAEGRLEIDCCGNSAELDKANDTIRAIEKLLNDMESATNGDIRGRVVKSVDTRARVAGIRVIARGGGKSYTAVTDKNGWFHIPVPPGMYVVTPQSAAWAFAAYDLSYDDPERVKVHRGGCAEVMFLASPK